MKKKIIPIICILLVLSVILSSCKKAGDGFGAVALADSTAFTHGTTVVGVPEELRPFYDKTTEYMLKTDDENVVFSPVGAYTVLSMLGECSQDKAKSEILDAFSGIDEQKSRTLTRDIICSVQNGAQSLWLPDNYRYNEQKLKNLNEYYMTSVYEGAYDSPEALDAMKEWMKANSFDTLDEMIDGFELTENSEMLVLNAISFKDAWMTPFNKAKTAPAPFYSKKGVETCEFMSMDGELEYKITKNFSCLSLPLKNGGRMTFMLPAEDKTLSEVMADEYARTALRYMPFCNDRSEGTVFIPKFDITQKNDLIGMAKSLGIEEIFNPNDHAFTDLAKGFKGNFIKTFFQMVNVSIDENGVEASAITGAEGSYKGMVDEKVFRFDRPFAYSIFNEKGMPVFMGTVCTFN